MSNTNGVSTEASEGGYNVITTLNSFKSAVQSDGVTIDIPKFIIAYKELVKFFDCIGKMFAFVTADLVDKFHNLERCLASSAHDHYLTVQSVVAYERTDKALFMSNSHGTLSILRLLRGLDFIRKMLEYLYANRDNARKSNELVWQAYDETLAFRHKWAVRQLAKAGLYLLPRKSDLFDMMLIGSDRQLAAAERDTLFQEFLDSLDRVFVIIHRVYSEHQFLELVVA